MKTKIRILKEIYIKNGSHAREICRNLKMGMPSVKNSLDQLKNLLTVKKSGRNIVYNLNYNKKEIIPYLYLIEYSRLKEFPKKVQYAVFDYLKSLNNKPLLTIIFGSYAKKQNIKDSDLDIFLVFNKVKKEAEEKARIISAKHGIAIEPVYMDYNGFSKEFYNQKKKFFQDLKNDKIIVNGIEWWVELKNEEA